LWWVDPSQAVVDGKEKALSASTFTFIHSTFSVDDATGQFRRLGLDGDGTFVWTLKPGDYTIAGFQAYAPLAWVESGRASARRARTRHLRRGAGESKC